jgi:hypothetical protein
VREFVLIDLQSQLPYLPPRMRTWPRERLLRWLAVWGEVRKIEQLSYPDADTYSFGSWIGLRTGFILTHDGRMFIPGTTIEAWSGVSSPRERLDGGLERPCDT